MLLSDVKIRNSKPREKAYRLNDGEGLYLVVRPNGGRYWQFRYRFAEKEKSLSLGKYPRVSLVEARRRKVATLNRLDGGIDPSARRKQEKLLAVFRERNSFLAIAGEWRDRNAAVWTEERTKQTWGRLSNHVLPYLGSRPVAEIKPLELLEVIRKVEAKGATDMSRRVLQICGAIFNYAIITGRAEYNITQGLSKALIPHRVKHYPALSEAELPEFLSVLEEFEVREQNKIALRLLLLTALRTGELRHGKWRDIDLEKKEWRIPAENTKMGTEHLVPLSSQAVRLLNLLRKLTGQGQWLFPNPFERIHPVISENAINDMLTKMGYKGRIVGHGFRSLFSTVLNEHGFNRDAIERQLAHMERNGVRAAYNRAEYLDERRRMMQWWADFLESKTKA